MTNDEKHDSIEKLERELNSVVLHFGRKSKEAEQVYITIANYYKKTQEFYKAIINYKKVLNIRLKINGKNSSEVAETYGEIGLAYRHNNNYDESIKFHKKALRIRKLIFGTNHLDIAKSLNHIAYTLYKSKDYNKALSYYKKSLKIKTTILGENSPDIADLYELTGVTQNVAGNIEESINSHENALRIRLASLDAYHSDVARSYYNIAYCLRKKKSYEKSIIFYEKALNIKTFIYDENSPEVADIFYKIGVNYSLSFNFNSLLEYMLRSLSIYLKLENQNDNICNCYEYISIYYMLNNSYLQAVDYLKKILDILYGDTYKFRYRIAKCLSAIADIYDSMRNYDEAIEHYIQALNIYLNSSNPPENKIAECHKKIANVYRSARNYDNAVEHYNQALNIYLNSSNPSQIDIADSYKSIGELYRQQGDKNNSKHYFKQAFNNYKDISPKNIVDSVNIISSILAIAVITSSHAMAINYTKILLNKIKYFINNIETIGSYYSLLLVECVKYGIRINNIIYIYEILEIGKGDSYLRRISLQTALQAESVTSKEREIILGLINSIENLKIRRDHETGKPIALKDNEAFLAVSDELKEKQAQFDTLHEKLMENENFRQLRDPRRATLEEAQALCDESTVILNYLIWEGDDKNKQSYCLVITRDTAVIEKLDPEYPYTDSIREFTGTGDGSGHPLQKERAFELYDRLLAPLEKHLAGKETILIVPDAALAFLPFDMLRKDDSSPFLCETYAVSLIPSVSVYKTVTERFHGEDRKEFLGFGVGTYENKKSRKKRDDTGKSRSLTEKEIEHYRATASQSGLRGYRERTREYLANLKTTIREIITIHRFFGPEKSKIYTEEEASEEKVRQLSQSGELAKFRAVHFACHGRYDEDIPQNSAVILSEFATRGADDPDAGFLDMNDIVLLNMRADVVVLSACKTGLGKIVRGDGIIGLTRSFIEAGANGVISTLWEVDDRYTGDFMVEVYRKVSPGKGKALSFRKALRQTKLEFIQKGADPSHWAGFVLWGR